MQSKESATLHHIVESQHPGDKKVSSHVFADSDPKVESLAKTGSHNSHLRGALAKRSVAVPNYAPEPTDATALTTGGIP